MSKCYDAVLLLIGRRRDQMNFFKTTTAIACTSLSIASTTVLGDISAISQTEYSGNWAITSVYLQSDDSAQLLNIFNSEVADFYYNHADLYAGQGGQWNSSHMLYIPGFTDPTLDSYVTIDGNIGNDTITALDPGWGNTGENYFSNGGGWYTGDGSINLYMNDGIKIAQFVYDAALTDNFYFNGTAGYKDNNGQVQFHDFQVAVPAPGALGLIALAGIIRKRRTA